MTGPRLAKAPITLRDEINANGPLAVRRAMAGSATTGVFCALDVTNDPARGLDA